MRTLTEEERALALSMARRAIQKALSGERYEPEELPPLFGDRRGVFVTLKRCGELRGCIGIPYPVMPLGEAIVESAISAALCDPRFPPVRERELAELKIEITILTPPERLDCPPQERPLHVRVGRHGIIVRRGRTSGLLLPQVAVEYGWKESEFLDHTCMKARLERDCWRSEQVEILTFEGEIISE
ncbi:MAG: TIGR00296 family protein [Methanomicrobiales archaeon]|nr:TIGR00296 family protein [Methanomicrobiales archaeon]